MLLLTCRCNIYPLFMYILQGVGVVRSVRQAKPQLLVGYWGQNGAGPFYGPAKYEKSLSHFCQSSMYDIINIGFINVLFEKRDRDQLPGMNFANHCGYSINIKHPFIFRCPRIEAGIRECQSRGKRVAISLGGSTGDGTLHSPEMAKKLAFNLWHLFLGGTGYGYESLRPFGTAILDGVDLDIEGGSPKHYAEFVKELRKLMNSDKKKKYIVSCAPQCPYPDAFLGPVHVGSALQGAGGLFDYLYVQFYNNYCWTGDRTFLPVLDKWINFANVQSPRKPKVLIGLPANTRASGHIQYYRPPQALESLYKSVRDKPGVGGIMLWDLSWDQNNMIGGVPYSYHASALVRKNKLPILPTLTTSPWPTSVATSLHSQTPYKRLQTLRPLITGTVNCKALQNGALYRHPTDEAKFIQCSHGKAYVLVCPNSLVFDEASLRCEWPAVNTQRPLSSRPAQRKTLLFSTQPTHPSPSPGVVKCKVLPDGALYSHPTDKTKFIQCSHGNPHIHTCPKFLVFIKINQRCEWSAVNTQKKQPPSSYQPQATTLLPSLLSSTRTTSEPPSPGQLRCSALPDGDYSHPADRTKFIKCSHGIKYIFNCPNGLVFNFLKRQCDWTMVFRFSLPLKPSKSNLKIKLLSH